MHGHLGTQCHQPTPRHLPPRDRCCRAYRAAAATPHLPGARPPRSAPGRPLFPPVRGRVVGTRGGSEVPAPQASSPVASSPQPAVLQRSRKSVWPSPAASSAGLGLRLWLLLHGGGGALALRGATATPGAWLWERTAGARPPGAVASTLGARRRVRSLWRPFPGPLPGHRVPWRVPRGDDTQTNRKKTQGPFLFMFSLGPGHQEVACLLDWDALCVLQLVKLGWGI